MRFPVSVFCCLILSCASGKIEKYGDRNTPYRKAELSQANLSDVFFSDAMAADSMTAYQITHLLDSLKEGNERYDIYYRYNLCEGSEREVEFCQDAVILNLVNGKINPGKSIYYRSNNELPHYFVKNLSQVEALQGPLKLSGFDPEGIATVLGFPFVGTPSNTIESIRTEKMRVMKLME